MGWFRRDPVKKKKQQYDQLLEQAMLAQRKGDIRNYSMLTAQAEALWTEIEALQKD
jgi:hypothetical protein